MLLPIVHITHSSDTGFTQGCISCGTCSYLELTEDHVLTSAYENAESIKEGTKGREGQPSLHPPRITKGRKAEEGQGGHTLDIVALLWCTGHQGAEVQVDKIRDLTTIRL